MLLFLFGLLLLIVGARALVFGASAVGTKLRLSPLIIGLTIVAFGTSSPEIAVCALAAYRGEGEIVMGNIVGSNIFNLLFILAWVALLRPIVVHRRLLFWDVPIMIFASLLFWAFSMLGGINRPEGVLLFLGIVIYLFFAFRTLKEEEVLKPKKRQIHIWWALLLIIFGLISLAIGSDSLIRGVEILAQTWALSPLFLSLTLVAIGTSLPEIATTVVCLAKKEGEIAIGSLIGSNIFNLFAVGGISALIHPIVVTEKMLYFDLPVMFATALAALPIAFTGHKISRWEGAIFLLYYALYLTYIFLSDFHAPLLPYFQTAFFGFIFPLTLLTLIVALWRHYRTFRH